MGGIKLGAPGHRVQDGTRLTVLYARNLFNFVQLLVDAKTKELKIDTERRSRARAPS